MVPVKYAPEMIIVLSYSGWLAMHDAKQGLPQKIKAFTIVRCIVILFSSVHESCSTHSDTDADGSQFYALCTLDVDMFASLLFSFYLCFVLV